MRPPIARDWANVSTDLMIIEPTPVASAALLAQADLWVFSLLTSPYIGTAHLTGSSVDSSGYSHTYDFHQHMTIRVAPGATGARLSMTTTRGSGFSLINHELWGSYDNSVTSNESEVYAHFGGLVWQGFSSEMINTSGSQHSTSPAADIDRQILIEAKKVSSSLAIRSSHHTACTVWIGHHHQDMGAI